MFSLIITIISIALVAALAVATLYYGGDAFTRGAADAAAAQLMNAGQQVQGAVVLFANDHAGARPVSADDLTVNGYLSGVPSVPTGATAGTVFNGANWEVTGVNTDVCASSKIASPAACAGSTFTFPL